jgi:hypothetical protein
MSYDTKQTSLTEQRRYQVTELTQSARQHLLTALNIDPKRYHYFGRSIPSSIAGDAWHVMGTPHLHPTLDRQAFILRRTERAGVSWVAAVQRYQRAQSKQRRWAYSAVRRSYAVYIFDGYGSGSLEIHPTSDAASARKLLQRLIRSW